MRRSLLRALHPIAVAAVAVVTFDAQPARAMDAEVTSDTAAQFYDVRSPTGEVVLPRRRVTTTLGVGVYDMLGNQGPSVKEPSKHLAPDILFRARLRYDADFGASSLETDKNDFSRLVPGFSRGPIDLMYGYVEGRRFLHGWLGFKLGRQYVTDALGWWSFDGGEVRVTTPFFVAVEGYGGLEVRGGMPLSTSRWERDGVWRGDRSGYDASLFPAFQPAAMAPAFGAAIESTGVPWLHARLTYRRVMNTGKSNATMFASGAFEPVTYEGSRISQERLGYSVDANAWSLGGLRAGLAYDLYLARMTNMYASVDAFVTQKLTVSGDYDFYQPAFDGDSIWNFFPAEPMNDFGLRAVYDATERFSVSGRAHVRAFGQETGPLKLDSSPNLPRTNNPNFYPSNGMAFNEGLNLAGSYKWGEGAVGVRGAGDFGDGGQRVGGDVYAQRVLESRYVVEGRASLWQWDDKIRPGRDAMSVGYVAGLGYRLATRSQALVEWEHNINRVSGQRFRLMLWLTVAVAQ